MSESVTVTNMPSSGTKEAVALELWKYLRDGKQTPEQQLAFFARCRAATYGASGYGIDKLT